MDELLTNQLACPHGCRVETEFDVERLRSRLYIWGADYKRVGCRLVLSTGAKMTVDSNRDAILRLAGETDRAMHRIEGEL